MSFDKKQGIALFFSAVVKLFGVNLQSQKNAVVSLCRPRQSRTEVKDLPRIVEGFGYGKKKRRRRTFLLAAFHAVICCSDIHRRFYRTLRHSSAASFW